MSFSSPVVNDASALRTSVVLCVSVCLATFSQYGFLWRLTGKQQSFVWEPSKHWEDVHTAGHWGLIINSFYSDHAKERQPLVVLVGVISNHNMADIYKGHSISNLCTIYDSHNTLLWFYKLFNNMYKKLLFLENKILMLDEPRRSKRFFFNIKNVLIFQYK